MGGGSQDFFVKVLKSMRGCACVRLQPRTCVRVCACVCVCVLIAVSAKVASVLHTHGFHHSECTQKTSLSLSVSLSSPLAVFIIKHFLMYPSF